MVTFTGSQGSDAMRDFRHRPVKKDVVVLSVSSLDGGLVELVRLKSSGLYSVRYRGVEAFPPKSFDVANKLLWSEFLD